MADGLHYRIEGLDVLDKRLKELDRRTKGNVLRVALRTGMNIVKAEAKKHVPVLSGRLKKGIQVKVTLKPYKGEAYAKLGFKKGVAWGVPVELGTSTAAAQPFLRPALDTKKDEAVAAFGDRMKDEIDKVTRVV